MSDWKEWFERNKDIGLEGPSGFASVEGMYQAFKARLMDEEIEDHNKAVRKAAGGIFDVSNNRTEREK